MSRTPPTLFALCLLTLSASLGFGQGLPNVPFGPGYSPPTPYCTPAPQRESWTDPPLPVRANATATPDSQASLAAKSQQHSLPLAPRGRAATAENAPSSASGNALLTTFGSLALVLCLFFIVAWIMRRGTPHALAVLPGEVVEILGRAPLPGRHHMHLVRCGNKLLLIAISAAGADTLTEITDPLEVDRLCGLCRENHPRSATSTFRNLLHQFGSEQESAQAPARTGRKSRFAGVDEEEAA